MPEGNQQLGSKRETPADDTIAREAERDDNLDIQLKKEEPTQVEEARQSESAETEEEKTKKIEQAVDAAYVFEQLRLRDVSHRYGNGIISRLRSVLNGEFDFGLESGTSLKSLKQFLNGEVKPTKLNVEKLKRNNYKFLARKAVVSLLNRRTLMGAASMVAVGALTGGVGAALYPIIGGVLGNIAGEIWQATRRGESPENARKDLYEIYRTYATSAPQILKELQERQNDIENSQDRTQRLETIVDNFYKDSTKNLDRVYAKHQEIYKQETKWGAKKAALFAVGAVIGAMGPSISEFLRSKVQELGMHDYDANGIYHRVVKIGKDYFYQVNSSDIALANSKNWPLQQFVLKGLEGTWHGLTAATTSAPQLFNPWIYASIVGAGAVSSLATGLIPVGGNRFRIEKMGREMTEEKQKAEGAKTENKEERNRRLLALEIIEKPGILAKPELAVDLPSWEIGKMYYYYTRLGQKTLLHLIKINKILIDERDSTKYYIADIYSEDAGTLTLISTKRISVESLIGAARVLVEPGKITSTPGYLGEQKEKLAKLVPEELRLGKTQERIKEQTKIRLNELENLITAAKAEETRLENAIQTAQDELETAKGKERKKLQGDMTRWRKRLQAQKEKTKKLEEEKDELLKESPEETQSQAEPDQPAQEPKELTLEQYEAEYNELTERYKQKIAELENEKNQLQSKLEQKLQENNYDSMSKEEKTEFSNKPEIAAIFNRINEIENEITEEKTRIVKETNELKEKYKEIIDQQKTLLAEEAKEADEITSKPTPETGPRTDETISRMAAWATIGRVKSFEDLNVSGLNEEERDREIEKRFIGITKEVWKDLVTHGKVDWIKNEQTGDFTPVMRAGSDLDVIVCLGILQMADIDTSNIEFVRPGEERPGKIHLDTGNKNGVDFNPETNTLYMDHHTPETSNELSAAHIVLETLKSLNPQKFSDIRLLDIENNPWLEDLANFTDKVDNLTYPMQDPNGRSRGVKYYTGELPYTLYGLYRNFRIGVQGERPGPTFEQLKQFFEDGYRQAGYRPDQKLSATTWAKYGITQQMIDQAKNNNEVSITILKQIKGKGFMVDSPKYGPIVIDLAGKVGGYMDAVRAFGCGVYLRWEPARNSFFISSLKPIYPGIEITNNEGERIGIPMRQHMWIKLPDRTELTPSLLVNILNQLGAPKSDIPSEAQIVQRLEEIKKYDEEKKQRKEAKKQAKTQTDQGTISAPELEQREIPADDTAKKRKFAYEPRKKESEQTERIKIEKFKEGSIYAIDTGDEIHYFKIIQTPKKDSPTLEARVYIYNKNRESFLTEGSLKDYFDEYTEDRALENLKNTGDALKAGDIPEGLSDVIEVDEQRDATPINPYSGESMNRRLEEEEQPEYEEKKIQAETFQAGRIYSFIDPKNANETVYLKITDTDGLLKGYVLRLDQTDNFVDKGGFIHIADDEENWRENDRALRNMMADGLVSEIINPDGKITNGFNGIEAEDQQTKAEAGGGEAGEPTPKAEAEKTEEQLELPGEKQTEPREETKPFPEPPEYIGDEEQELKKYGTTPKLIEVKGVIPVIEGGKVNGSVRQLLIKEGFLNELPPNTIFMITPDNKYVLENVNDNFNINEGFFWEDENYQFYSRGQKYQRAMDIRHNNRDKQIITTIEYLGLDENNNAGLVFNPQ